jgi:hypothetical protein
VKLTKADRELLRKIGRIGGRATAKRLTAEERKASATKAANARWKRAAITAEENGAEARP